MGKILGAKEQPKRPDSSLRATRHEYWSILTLKGWSQAWPIWSNSPIAVERSIVLIEHRVASAEMAPLPSSRDLACRHGTPVHSLVLPASEFAPGRRLWVRADGAPREIRLFVLLEQGTLSCGTTWHAAGLVGQLRASEAGTRLVQYSCELYDRIEAETGLSAGYRRCGGLTVARTPERMVTLRRTAASAAAYGLDCDLLTPDQAGERYPLIRTDDLVGAIWLPAPGRRYRFSPAQIGVRVRDVTALCAAMFSGGTGSSSQRRS